MEDIATEATREYNRNLADSFMGSFNQILARDGFSPAYVENSPGSYTLNGISNSYDFVGVFVGKEVMTFEKRAGPVPKNSKVHTNIFSIIRGTVISVDNGTYTNSGYSGTNYQHSAKVLIVQDADGATRKIFLVPQTIGDSYGYHLQGPVWVK